MNATHRLFACALVALSVWLPARANAALPISSHDTPAWKTAAKFKRGVNLANFLEVRPEGHWSVPHDLVDLKEIRAEGFDHIRLPTGWAYYVGPAPDYAIGGDIFQRADAIVTNAVALGLGVIINIHGFDAFTTDPAANREEFFAIWRQVAAHYADAPATVVFEPINEPHDAATTAVMNPIYARFVAEVRKTNPHRTLFIGPGQWNSASELPKLELPQDDNIVVTVHCYEPFFFTHQGATWAGPAVKPLKGIQFPGPPQTPWEPLPGVEYQDWILKTLRAYNTEPTDRNPSGPKAFLPRIHDAVQWSEKTGRPIHFGEFGAFRNADQASRARYYKAMRQALEAAGFGWAIWDWKSGFNYWDAQNHRPLPGMREALFPDRQLPPK